MARDTLAILGMIRKARVLSVGDLMLDVYIHGEAARLSPEAPVPIVRVARRLLMPGGMGNVVMNLRALGAKPMALGLLGQDDSGRRLRKLLMPGKSQGDMALVVDKGRPTTVKTRVIAGIQQVVRYDEESLLPASPLVCARVKKEAKRLLSTAKSLSLSDYGKGLLDEKLTQWFVRAAKAHDIPVLVDPKGPDWRPYAGATLVTPNRQELSMALGRDLTHASSKDLAKGASELIERHGIRNILVTRSEDGMSLVSQGGKSWHLPTRARAVFDVSGAGDTVVAAMAAALAAGATLREGAMLATLAAGVVVGKVGTSTASPEEIMESLAIERAEREGS
ncbi:MAG: PfkB family carbohydrate kinase [Deltaproteobacteria bacterium]|jgi:D-beta-D-heptose 7-phosphate kinase/D-beta-D-heptose 1-phosphate adenosyltransferase|nr:PfkB family carbohydrate kinase [Deltaproteobacteria bacterium]